MGTPGMRMSLISRELIADSIEMVVDGNQLDGVMALVGCDKTIPGGAMALARVNVPGVLLYGGSIAPGHFGGKDVTIQDVFEAVGAEAAGRMTTDQRVRPRGRRLPRRGRLRRPVHRQHHGGRLRIPRSVADGQQQRAGNRSSQGRDCQGGRRARRGPGSARRPSATHPDALTPSRTPSRRSRPQAARPTPCCTCWPSRAKPASTLDLETFNRISASVPWLADLKAGRPLRGDRHASRGRQRGRRQSACRSGRAQDKCRSP